MYEINKNSEKRYMDGKINLLIRWYFYFKEAINQISGMRTLGYALIGIAGVLAVSKSSTSYWTLILIGLACVPPLTVFGWMWVIRGKKSEEYYQLKYTSPFGRYGVQLQEKQVENSDKIIEQNNKIIELLEKLNENIDG